MYLLIAAGAIFIVTPLAITPEVHCREYECPAWLRATLVAIGAMFGGGALLALLRGLVWGSRLDTVRGDIVWWHGAPPVKEERIAISHIERIRVSEGDSATLTLYASDGRKLYMPTECVRSPAEWAVAMVERYASIKLELPDRRVKSEDDTR
jgi:hypothetical protein